MGVNLKRLASEYYEYLTKLSKYRDFDGYKYMNYFDRKVKMCKHGWSSFLFDLLYRIPEYDCSKELVEDFKSLYNFNETELEPKDIKDFIEFLHYAHENFFYNHGDDYELGENYICLKYDVFSIKYEFDEIPVKSSVIIANNTEDDDHETKVSNKTNTIMRIKYTSEPNTGTPVSEETIIFVDYPNNMMNDITWLKRIKNITFRLLYRDIIFRVLNSMLDVVPGKYISSQKVHGVADYVYKKSTI